MQYNNDGKNVHACYTCFCSHSCYQFLLYRSTALNVSSTRFSICVQYGPTSRRKVFTTGKSDTKIILTEEQGNSSG